VHRSRPSMLPEDLSRGLVQAEHSLLALRLVAVVPPGLHVGGGPFLYGAIPQPATASRRTSAEGTIEADLAEYS
jgi:hypothetical protein